MFKYTLEEYGAEVQAVIDKVQALVELGGDDATLLTAADKAKLDALGIYCDTTANWAEATGFIPAKGNIVIYTDHRSLEGAPIPGIKIGTGNAYVQDLAFIDDAIAADLYAHINNSNIHITAQERTFWNNKLNVNDSAEVVGENLIFTRN